MFLPSTMQVLCTTWFMEVNLFRILMLFVSGINQKKEHCLSLAWILTSKYQSIVDERMKIKKHIQSGKYVGRVHSELSHCLVMKDQWDYVLNVLEELGNRELFLKYQCSTDISFLLLLLLPSMPSNDHQTNTVFVEIIPKIILNFPELNSSVVFSLYNVEEDWLLSSKSRTKREKNFLVQYQSTSFYSSEWCSVIQQFLSFVVLLLPLIWL